MPVADAFSIASSKVGLNSRNAALRDFLYNGGQNLDPATRTWCADFMNASLRESGLPGTGSGAARSFLNYGAPVNLPQRGDIAVFTRGDPNGPYGHVGFYDGEDESGIRILGGNQGPGREVSYSVMPRDRLLAFRRPTGEPAFSDKNATQSLTAPAEQTGFLESIYTDTSAAPLTPPQLRPQSAPPLQEPETASLFLDPAFEPRSKKLRRKQEKLHFV